MHFLHTLEFIFVNHLDVDDDDGDVEMHAGEWVGRWMAALSFKPSQHLD